MPGTLLDLMVFLSALGALIATLLLVLPWLPALVLILPLRVLLLSLIALWLLPGGLGLLLTVLLLRPVLVLPLCLLLLWLPLLLALARRLLGLLLAPSALI
jgi:hypothetical protein